MSFLQYSIILSFWQCRITLNTYTVYKFHYVNSLRYFKVHENNQSTFLKHSKYLHLYLDNKCFLLLTKLLSLINYIYIKNTCLSVVVLLYLTCCQIDSRRASTLLSRTLTQCQCEDIRKYCPGGLQGLRDSSALFPPLSCKNQNSLGPEVGMLEIVPSGCWEPPL